MTSTRQRGDHGEDIACDHLDSLGWRILDRNVTYRAGELDIVAEDPPYLVFVEVRSTARRHSVRPEDSITRPKQLRLSRAARLYLARYRGSSPYARFDVMVVDRTEARVIAHHRAAFEAIGGS